MLAILERAGKLGVSSVGADRLKALAYERLGNPSKAAESRKAAENSALSSIALDFFLEGERHRDESSARLGEDTDRKPWQKNPEGMRTAIDSYRKALAIDPDHYWSRLQLGRCYQHLDRFAEAIEALGACIAIRPEAPWGYTARGVALALQGRADEAEHDFNRAIRLNPEARPPLLHRGVNYWKQKKYDLAKADFEAVLKPPDSKRLVEAAYYRGQLYLELNEPEKALADFDLVVASIPAFRSVYLDRPLIYLARGDVTHALADLDAYIVRVREVDPKGWEIHGLRGRLLRHIYTQFSHAKRQLPLGQAVLTLAVSELLTSVKKGGQASGVFDDLGAMMEHAGRLDQAIASYSRGLELDPNDVKLLIKRGWDLQQLNQNVKAAADFAAASRVDPENAEAHTGLGYVQALRTLPPDAQREADLALLHGSDDYLVLHNVACIYAALSRNAKVPTPEYEDVSIALLRRAVKLWKRDGAEPSELDLMRDEPAFEPIRDRKDFQELMSSGGTL